jgi:uncharacterized sulfatase
MAERVFLRPALPLVLVACAAAAAAAAPPNVVLVVSDDQHWGDYGFMGHPAIRTPNLDRLARESLVFPRGYATSSLCCPSLASLITGRYPHEHGIVGNDPPEHPRETRESPAGQATFAAGRERMNRMLEAFPTLPAVLGKAGYRSLQTGKWWQGDFRRGGFDAGMTQGERHGDAGLAIGRDTMQPIYDFVTTCRKEEKPFFIWYAPMLPHAPFDPPRELLAHYESRTDSVHVARYWANVERFDRTIGDLLAFLDREKLAADTLVVFVTDNGWIQDPTRSHFAPRSKLSPYEGGLRTPIMLRRPGTIAPRTDDAVASAIDLMPTILAACGVKPPNALPGINLLDAERTAARKQVFGECYTHSLLDLDAPARSLLWRWTVRAEPDGRIWKLIVPTSADRGGTVPDREGRNVDAVSRARYAKGAVELFDVAADPAEDRNLAAEQPAVAERLRKSLDDWWQPAVAAAPGRGAGEPLPASGSPSAASQPRNRPNLLVFLADDLGAHDLGCTGSRGYITPAIDALAAAGMIFTRGYAASTVCSPTRAALMTGRHPARVQITQFIYIGGQRHGSLTPPEFLRALPESERTVPERLQRAGYATGCFGKWHLGPAEDVRRQGFDAVGSNRTEPGSGPAHDPHHARAIAAQACSFIESHRGRPWFCYVPMHSVHVPLQARPDLVAAEKTRIAALPPAAGPWEVAEGDRQARAVQDMPLYAAMVREMDETVATVLDTVTKTDQAGETLVVFTSDNGGLATAEGAPTSNLPLRAGKGYLYEGGIRAPLLVRWPGVVAAGSTCAVPVTTLDIAATILDVAGAPPEKEESLDGTSLRPLLSATVSLPSRDLFWHYPHYSNQGGRPAGALIAGDGPAGGTEKLVEHFEDGRVELFDLAADPGERQDLSATRPERAGELAKRLAAWRTRISAAMPTPNPNPVDPYGPKAFLPSK